MPSAWLKPLVTCSIASSCSASPALARTMSCAPSSLMTAVCWLRNPKTEMADTLHVYDAARQRFRSGLDLDQNGQLTLASSDPDYGGRSLLLARPANHWWRTRQARVYPEAQSALPTVVSEQRTRLNGFEPQQASEIVTLDTQGIKAASPPQ